MVEHFTRLRNQNSKWNQYEYMKSPLEQHPTANMTDKELSKLALRRETIQNICDITK